MDIRRRFPEVHWIWQGGISFVYEVHPRIVVKVPKTGEYEREQFRKELKIYEIFSQHQPCPSIVQCFHYADNGIFLEYMRDVTLSSRIQLNHTRDQETCLVTKVEALEPLSRRKEWMNDLAQAVAFLESLNLAHGDLRPENILLDRNRLKLSDFDSTAEIGSHFEACVPPYGRVLGKAEQDQGRRGSPGLVGPRTEQFALGSLYYFINYGFEVYADRSLTIEPKERGPKLVELLQNMEFPELDGDPLIDNIITKCWHNKFTTIGELAAQTEMHLRMLWRARGVTKGEADSGVSGGCPAGCPDSRSKPHNEHTEPHNSAEDFVSKQNVCQDLENCGLLQILSSEEPEKLGFSIEWYRYSKS